MRTTKARRMKLRGRPSAADCLTQEGHGDRCRLAHGPCAACSAAAQESAELAAREATERDAYWSRED